GNCDSQCHLLRTSIPYLSRMRGDGVRGREIDWPLQRCLHRCYSRPINGRPMGNAKQQVESLLHKLPDNCSLEDIQYHLYVLDKVRRGVDEARQQGTVSQEDAEKRLSQWLSE